MSEIKKARPFDTFARWKPLTESQLEQGEVLRNTNFEENSLYSISIDYDDKRNWKTPGAFQNIYQPADNNGKVFEDVISQAIPKILNGASCNVFAYGHTGSGKTHTIIGYDYDQENELGLCLAAAQRLFKALEAVESDEKLGVGFSLFELRKNIVVDLLNGKQECHIRQGADGKIHIQGETEMLENGKVRVKPVMKRACWNYEDLRDCLRDSIGMRQVGQSSVHDQSSRTHAVLEIEIVNSALVDAREDLYERQAELIPVGKRATDIYLRETWKSLIQHDDGTWKTNPDRPVDQVVIDVAEAEKREYEARVVAAERKVQDLLDGTACLGGSYVFVDLAGSEYHACSASPAHMKEQTQQEKQQGRQINTDILALKEVIRAVASDQKHIPFRSSPLTMVLRDHFLRSKAGSSAMIVTVSPSIEQYGATLNSLRYGALVGAARA